MKKEKKVVYGIEIVKPWSTEMYDHNEAVAEVVKNEVARMWEEAYKKAEAEFIAEDELDNDFLASDWDQLASPEMIKIQKAVTCYGFGFGFPIGQVAETVEDEIEEAPLYRLNDMVDELDIKLEKGFVGFN